MRITIHYETQLKRAAGVATESVDVPDGATLGESIRSVAARHGEEVQTMLLNSEGDVRASVLVFLGDRQVLPNEAVSLSDGDTLILMSPISGG